MQELVKKVSELVELLVAKNAKADELVSSLEQQNNEIEAEQAELDATATELSERERQVLKVEDVVKLKEEADALKSQAEVELKAVAKAQDVLEQRKATDLEAILKLKGETSTEQARIKNEDAQLIKNWELFREEKENWKEKAKAELLKKLS